MEVINYLKSPETVENIIISFLVFCVVYVIVACISERKKKACKRRIAKIGAEIQEARIAKLEAKIREMSDNDSKDILQ